MRSTDKWNKVCDYYRRVFYKPDLDTLRIVLSSICSHYLLNEPPVWLFVIGPSSAGKTTQMIEPLRSLKLVKSLDVINDKTFVNGYEDKTPPVTVKGKGVIKPEGDGGLLFRLPGKDPIKHGIVTFSDWSMFTSLKADTRQALQGQFRGMYDGHISHSIGNNKMITWDGKITMIIAGTKEVEEEMGNMSGLGDRFLKVRMRFIEGIDERIEMFNKAAKNMGKKGGIKESLEQLIFSLIEGDDLQKASITISKASINFPYLLEIASLLRRNIIRDRRNNKILSIGETENNTRIASGAIQIARGSAMLLRQSSILQTDMRLAMRTIIDNIPFDRWSVIRDLACTPNGQCTTFGLESKYHTIFSPYGLSLTIEELEHLGVIKTEQRRATTGHRYTRLTLDPKLLSLMKKAFKTNKLKNHYLKETHGLNLNSTKPLISKKMGERER